MTLIPLISAMMTAPEVTTAPAGRSETIARNIYGSDHGRHPVAALLAVGLPAALLVAVALSPMIVEPPPKAAPIHGTLVELDKPLDPPPPDTKAEKKAESQSQSPSTTETVDPVGPTIFNDNVVDSGPKIGDPVLPNPGDIYVPPADPPMPKLVLAELDPRYAGAFQPDYPASEQRREIEGVAKVRVLIGTDGRVKAVELVSTDSPGFFAETKRRALAKWRFKPATRGGVAEESWKTMTVRFEIRAT
jgi:protein TonB